MKFWAVIWQRWYVEMKYFEEMFFVWGSFNSLELKYLVILTSCSFSATRLICCRNWVFSRIRFWATFTNSVFLPFSVSIKLSSLTLENGKRFLLIWLCNTTVIYLVLAIHGFVYLSCYICDVPRYHLCRTELSQNCLQLVGNIFYMDNVLPYLIS